MNDQGGEIEECLLGDPTVENAILSSELDSLTEVDFQLDFMDFVGHCHCTLFVYSAKNRNGCYAKASVAGEEFENLVVNHFWPRERRPESFFVACEF